MWRPKNNLNFGLPSRHALRYLCQSFVYCCRTMWDSNPYGPYKRMTIKDYQVDWNVQFLQIHCLLVYKRYYVLEYFNGRNFHGTNFREVADSRNLWDLFLRMVVFRIFRNDQMGRMPYVKTQRKINWNLYFGRDEAVFLNFTRLIFTNFWNSIFGGEFIFVKSQKLVPQKLLPSKYLFLSLYNIFI